LRANQVTIEAVVVIPVKTIVTGRLPSSSRKRVQIPPIRMPMIVAVLLLRIRTLRRWWSFTVGVYFELPGRFLDSNN